MLITAAKYTPLVMYMGAFLVPF